MARSTIVEALESGFQTHLERLSQSQRPGKVSDKVESEARELASFS